MYTYQIKTQPDYQVDIEVNILKETINEYYNQSFEDLRKELMVEGFRKGNVPKKIAEKKINKSKVYEQLMKKLLPKIYQEIIQKENLQPIIEPQVDLKTIKENEDWKLIIKFALKPKINLKDYKKIVSEYNKKAKKADIWVPGKLKNENQEEKDKEVKRVEDINQIFNLLLKEVDCPIAQIIIEQELNRKLSALIDELQKIGLTIEAYLKSKNLTLERLKENYKKEISDTYRLEFILQEIADKENIIVEEKDIELLLSNIKDEKERLIAKKNSYLYASLLRKQKTIDFLINL